VTISGRLAWVGMNIDIGDSRTSGLIWDLRAWTARASLDKKISGGWSSLMRNGNGRREWDGSDLVVIVKDGLVHSEGLSVYPLGCWVDCWRHHKKVGMACSISEPRSLFPL